jgi:putative hydrolase of the HAD superfamily
LRETILFIDLDGTIMVNPFARYVFPAVLGRLAEATGMTYSALMDAITAENWRRQHMPSPQSAAWVMDWDDIIADVARQHGAPPDTIAPGACEWLARQHAAPPDSATLDDAVTVLARIRATGCRRLVVSSMGLSKYQFPVMRGLGLYACFDDFLMPDLVGALKFERAFYARYLESPDGRLFISVGDNYLHDVAFPRSLGFRSVLRLPVPGLARLDPFERPARTATYGHMIQYYPADPAAATTLPDAIVTDLAELPAVIERIEAQAV